MAQKKLYRSDDKVMSGICGGIGEYTDVDPTVIRLIWVILTLVTGIIGGVILYIIAALVIPEKPNNSGKKTTKKKSKTKKK